MKQFAKTARRSYETGGRWRVQWQSSKQAFWTKQFLPVQWIFMSFNIYFYSDSEALLPSFSSLC